jgi:hypothetical protein
MIELNLKKMIPLPHKSEQKREIEMETFFSDQKAWV